jgi:serine protease Do
MSKSFAFVTVALAAVVAFMLGLTVAASLAPPPVAAVGLTAGTSPSGSTALPLATASRVSLAGAASQSVNFADVAARLNPAVVNVDAASRGRGNAGRSRRGPLPPGHPRMPSVPEGDEDPSGENLDPNAPFEGSGSGFIIEADGHILTNYHVIEGAERIIVTLADGRNLRAKLVGSDPAADLALLKVTTPDPLPTAPLGDSSRLRAGEWVCAIGNPLAYEHTVTVGVVSYLGRKLDTSLDDYIQTDAAINFGNSGGPLINTRGEVIGINAAISWRASSIGFAIPINQAKAVLPQMKARGRVSRGYLGITLLDLDPDLARTLKLPVRGGALVQDVTPGTPGESAGLRPYDVILSVDGAETRTSDDLIRAIASREAGTTARLELQREGERQTVNVRLAERPDVDEDRKGGDRTAPRPGGAKEAVPAALIGMHVAKLEPALARRLALPAGMVGVVVTSVEQLGAAEEAGIDHGDIVLEINRQPVRSVDDYQRLVAAVKAGDVLAVFCYVPGLGQRALRTVHVEPWQE